MTTIERLVDVWNGSTGEYVTIPAIEVADWYANRKDCKMSELPSCYSSSEPSERDRAYVRSFNWLLTLSYL